MADKKVIAVAGATGAQGGGLVRAILADPDGEFAVRALTRDPGSEKARALTVSRQLHPGMQRFDEWLAVNATRIPIE